MQSEQIPNDEDEQNNITENFSLSFQKNNKNQKILYIFVVVLIILTLAGVSTFIVMRYDKIKYKKLQQEVQQPQQKGRIQTTQPVKQQTKMKQQSGKQQVDKQSVKKQQQQKIVQSVKKQLQQSVKKDLVLNDNQIRENTDANIHKLLKEKNVPPQERKRLLEMITRKDSGPPPLNYDRKNKQHQFMSPTLNKP